MTGAPHPPMGPHPDWRPESLLPKMQRAQPGQAFDLLDIVARRYLIDTCRLVRLRHQGDDGIRDVWCLCNAVAGGDDVEVHVLTERAGFTEWFVLHDEAQARDYFLDFFPLQGRPYLLPSLLEPGSLPGRGPRLVLEWFTPLEDFERAAMHEVLEQHPFRLSRCDADRFVVEACLLVGNRVEACTIELFARDSTVFGHQADGRNVAGNELIAPKGAFRITSTTPTRACIPDNHRVQPGCLPGATPLLPLDGPDRWQTVAHDEASLIRRDLQRLVWEPLPAIDLPRGPGLLSDEAGHMRRRPLGFYGLDLLELNGDGPEPQQAHVLWRPGFARVLDGSSSPIHKQNACCAGSPLLASADEAADYLRFFCQHVWADQGPFHVLEDRMDPAVVSLGPTVATGGPEGGTSVDALLDGIAPPRLLETLEDATGGRAFRFSAFVLYGNAVFEAVLKVGDGGMIEMQGDEALLRGTADSGGEEWPRRKALAYRELRNIDRTAMAVTDGRGIRTRLLGDADEPEGAIAIERCILRGPVDLSSCSIDRPLTFRGCIFEAGLLADDLQCGGRLHFDDCIFLETGRSGVALSLARASAGSIRLERITSHGSIHAPNARVANQLEVLHVDVSSALDLKGANSWSVDGFVIRAWRGLLLPHAVVQQYILLHSISAGSAADTRVSIDLTSTAVAHGHVALAELRLDGHLDASFVRTATGIVVDSESLPDGGEIGGELRLNAAVAPGMVRIRGMRVAGDLQLRRLETGILHLLGKQVALQPQAGPPARPDEPQPVRMRIGGSIVASFAHLRGEALIAGVTVESALRLEQAQIEGDLHLQATRCTYRKWQPVAGLEYCYSAFAGGIDLKGATVGGDARLDGVDCASADIQLEDATFESDVTLRRLGTGMFASAANLRLDGVTCNGSLDLTGLRLGGGEGAGNVDARFARFGKDVCVALREVGSALIPGHLDLTGSAIAELILSPDTFQPATGRPVTPGDVVRHGVILKEARINKFTICHQGDFYPAPIDLRHAEVKWWEFMDAGAAGERGHSDNVEDYIKLLRGDPHRQMHTFRSIEQNLVNRGHEDAADAIHWEMRKWLAKSAPALRGTRVRHPLRTVKLWTWDWLTSYRHGPLHILAIIAVWLALSTLVFSDADNIAPTGDHVSAGQNAATGQRPGPWGWPDGFWIALRHHVPVALFTARNEWKPADDAPVRIGGWTVPLLSPEDYGNIVLLLHWLLWPVMLLTASRKYFRRSGSQ